MFVAPFSNASAFRLARASSAAFVFASAESSCPEARAGSATSHSNAAAHTAVRLAVFIRHSLPSTVLWARRDDAAGRQRERSDQAGARLVPRAADFDRQGLPDALFEIGLADIANPEPGGRRPFGLPALHRAGIALHLERQVRVGVPPIDRRQGAFQRE